MTVASLLSRPSPKSRTAPLAAPRLVFVLALVLGSLSERSLALGADPSSLTDDEIVFLTLLHEPVPLPSSGGESIRVLVIPAFSEPFAVRVDSTGHSFRLTSSCLSGAGGYDPGDLAARTSTMPDPSSVSEALKEIGEHVFSSTLVDDSLMCLDGASWIYEFRSGDTYRYASRRCPDDAFVSPGASLARLSPFSFSELQDRPADDLLAP